eukprot:535559-Prymnesium_polylepis.1
MSFRPPAPQCSARVLSGLRCVLRSRHRRARTAHGRLRFSFFRTRTAAPGRGPHNRTAHALETAGRIAGARNGSWSSSARRPAGGHAWHTLTESTL